MLTGCYECGNLEFAQRGWIGFNGILSLAQRAGCCLQLKRTALHLRDAIAQWRRSVSERPCVNDGAHRGVDVTALQRRLFGLPGGLQLTGRLQPWRRSGHQHKRRDALGRGHRHTQGHCPAKRVADQSRAIDAKRIHGLQHVRPRVKFAAGNRLAELRKVHRDSPIPSIRDRAKVLSPHRPVRDTRMQEHHGRAGTNVIARQEHTTNYAPRTEAARPEWSSSQFHSPAQTRVSALATMSLSRPSSLSPQRESVSFSYSRAKDERGELDEDPTLPTSSL